MSRSVRCWSILGALLVTAPVSATEYYSVTDLGSLGNPLGSGAAAVNVSGDAVGYAFVAGSSYVHAVLSRGGQLTDLGTLGGTQSLARAINSSGDIVGWAYAPGSTSLRAVLWRGGLPTDLGTLGGAHADARDVNDAGLVVGSSFDAQGRERAFWWDGSMHDLGTLGGTQARAYAINDWGDIVGMAAPASNDRFHAFFGKRGSPLYDLGTLGGKVSHAYDVNERGHACGWSQVAYSPVESRAFFWADGVMKEIGTAGGIYSAGYALNAHDEVVGMTSRADGVYVAFRWRNGTLVDLNSLLPEGSPWTLESAWDVDDNGVIVGQGHLNGQSRAFAMTPVQATSVLPVATPAAVRLLGARPNPIAGSAHFDFELPGLTRARLELFDLGGRRIRDLADGWFAAGRTSVRWDGLDDSGRRPAAGTYWARLTSEGRSWTKVFAVAR